MKISEIKNGMNKITVEGVVVNISEPRTVNTKYNKSVRVAECLIKDDTGSIICSLWEDQIDMVKEGDTIIIENGYVTSFRGEDRLNVGKYGKLTVGNER
ncbi:MAG: hypothetical protein KatS3mg003_1122 [Candidatus Nitrosocaldaceae archaeon]|nr:MAG: hypothetical protein KatS3mg003_1122 [Candidatus Nitrosocaldaceae archaeon]